MQNKEPIAKCRQDAGLTIDQLADRLKVDRTTVMRWERGEPRIPPKRLAAVATALNVRKIDLRPDLLADLLSGVA